MDGTEWYLSGKVRSISDPLEHLVNQVEILRHQPSYLAN